MLLAEALRPRSLDDCVGQKHLLGEKGRLRQLVSLRPIPSLLFWGPPGTGKTTVARLLSSLAGAEFIEVSAMSTGTQELKKSLGQSFLGIPPFLFIDEIHRLTKVQQDVLLPALEKGECTCIGATTEDPSFVLSPALLSRMHVCPFYSLSRDDLLILLQRGCKHLEIKSLSTDVVSYLCDIANGDGRAILKYLESAGDALEDISALKKFFDTSLAYGHNADIRYAYISVLHKAVRGSDVDGALYWFSRLLACGEDILYVGRRLLRMASEDIGLSDPSCLSYVLDALRAYTRLGSPEGDICIAQAVVYLASAPKSNRLYKAFKRAQSHAEKTQSHAPPSFALNSTTSLHNSLQYGKGYIYDHDCPHAYAGQDFFPESLDRVSYYRPSNSGYERLLQKRFDFWESLKNRRL